MDIWPSGETMITALLGQDFFKVLASVHGVIALFCICAAAVSIYLGWKLVSDRLADTADLKSISILISILSFMTIVFGNWIYIRYRSSDAESAKNWLLAHNPVVHSVFFEFKEFIGLFTFPLTVAVAAILIQYGNQVLKEKYLRITVGLILAVAFFYLILTFGLGAAITRVRPI